jgi:Mce-associated membrane protein
MNDDEVTNDVRTADVLDEETSAADAESAETEAADPEGVEAAESPEAPAERREWTLSLPVLAGLGLVLVLALAAAVVFGWLYLAQSSDESARNEALATARAYAVTVTSYDYRDMEGSIADALDGATGEFKDQYAGASDALKALMTETKATATGEVLDAAVVTADDDSATVLLFVDQKVTNAGTKKTKVDRNRLLLTMEKHDDRWLVSDLKLK